MTEEEIYALVYEAIDSVDLEYDYCYCDEDFCPHDTGYYDKSAQARAVVEKLLAKKAVSVSTQAPGCKHRERDMLGYCIACEEHVPNKENT